MEPEITKKKWKDGTSYAGEIFGNLPNGYGVLRGKNGTKYIGYWVKGCKEDNNGRFQFHADGKSYHFVGGWKDDLPVLTGEYKIYVVSDNGWNPLDAKSKDELLLSVIENARDCTPYKIKDPNFSRNLPAAQKYPEFVFGYVLPFEIIKNGTPQMKYMMRLGATSKNQTADEVYHHYIQDIARLWGYFFEGPMDVSRKGFRRIDQLFRDQMLLFFAQKNNTVNAIFQKLSNFEIVDPNWFGDFLKKVAEDAEFKNELSIRGFDKKCFKDVGELNWILIDQETVNSLDELKDNYLHSNQMYFENYLEYVEQILVERFNDPKHHLVKKEEEAESYVLKIPNCNISSFFQTNTKEKKATKSFNGQQYGKESTYWRMFKDIN